MDLDVGHYVKAVYEFTGQNSAELSLHVGDLVKVVKIVDDSWLQGESIFGDSGLVPIDFVQHVVFPCILMGQQAFIAVADFPAQQYGDLDFTKGLECVDIFCLAYYLTIKKNYSTIIFICSNDSV